MGHTIVAIVFIAGLHLIACHDVPANSTRPWPDGTYALPMPSSGCPSGGGEDGFSWLTGYIEQDNEDFFNKNYCPSPWVFEGSCNKNLKIFYCIKTVTSSDRGIKWPKGSYCIVKKGECPTGFSEGSIFWTIKHNHVHACKVSICRVSFFRIMHKTLSKWVINLLVRLHGVLRFGLYPLAQNFMKLSSQVYITYF